MFDQREKIALLIDGVNLFAASKALGFNIDYRKLLEAFRKRAYLLRANYYAALVEDQETSSIRPLIAWLDYNGYRVVTKPVREFTDSLGRRKVEGNMDVELAIDAIELAETADHLVIFSGDGNFTSLVAALQRKGRKVSVVSSMSTRPPMISDALRREADHFIDLVKLRAEISRETPERASNGSENRPAVSTPEA
ncbi:NYN domain-containing protein [Sinorhizobium meliloti]|uniref:LabA-like NYN domain-containing protein n=1 Tax=Rhizobium meliloti TaxID=382 RepID=UPI0012980EE3|nr:NYN domain-containing protein [Sinorhizobium meliloti]MDW9487243.1 NYN domain-containing protein [Sinorhizobium meliloti]MDW9605914.1 NYN domain-containing protein [Sinorhizobium meliloti]MDW9677331.1 NYN domain-containing protein [Sinorhizobium meliloti]MDW9956189.1 NYN domain-containing protein [Sinorhizobium meliloti]MDX0391000.1 NYN domain-containing protein [Sinorhizobium meliloti]